MLLLFAFFQQNLRVLYGFLILKQSHSAIFPPEKDSFQSPFLRFLKCGNNYQTYQNRFRTKASEGFRAFRAWKGPHFLVINQQLRKYHESTASVRSLLLLLVMVVWPYVYLNYWQQAFIDLRSTEDKDDENAALFGHDFHDFLLCFHEGCAEIPLQVLPNFPHDIHDHCAGRLDGR